MNMGIIAAQKQKIIQRTPTTNVIAEPRLESPGPRNE